MERDMPESWLDKAVSYGENREAAKRWLGLVEEARHRFYDEFFNFALANWGGIVREMSTREIRRALELMRAHFGTGERAMLDYIIKRPTAELRDRVATAPVAIRKVLLEKTANNFLMNHLVPGTFRGEWPADEWGRAFGKHYVTYFVSKFPLSDEFAYLRVDTAHRLGSEVQREVASLLDRMRRLHEMAARDAARAESLRASLRREREARAALEDELSQARGEIDRLTGLLEAARAKTGEARRAEQARKIEELEAIIREKDEVIARLGG